MRIGQTYAIKLGLMTTALVTGATAGLGLSFARQLAASGHDVVLVARTVDRLEAVAEELRGFGHQVEVLAADLSDRAELQKVADRLSQTERPIEILVNNAGFGMKESFLDAEISAEEELLAVLCRAVLVLSHAAAQAMKPRGRGSIINVSSVAGFSTIGTYSAAKAWVTTFSEAISSELKPLGITVTALCPGFVHTEFHQRAEINMASLPEFGWLKAEDVVRQALVDARRGRVLSIPSVRFKVVASVARHAPRSLVRKASGSLRDNRSVASEGHNNP